MAAFIVVEFYSDAPLLPLSLFRSRRFSGLNLLTLFLYGALSGLLFFLPLNLVQVQGYSVTSAGASVLPFIVLMFLLQRWSGGLVDRFGARRPLIVGPVIVAIGFALFAMPGTGGSYFAWAGNGDHYCAPDDIHHEFRFTRSCRHGLRNQ
jgi:nitrate/nitrite transporter NarK